MNHISNIRIVFILICFSVPSLLKAQDPEWKLNLADYEMRMSVRALLKINGIESRDTADIVAAFVGTEVRGMGKPDVYLASTDQYLLYFQIGSNIAAGEIVTFKFYRKSENKLYEVPKSTTFIADGSLGTTNTPYVITNNVLPTHPPVLENSVLSIPENSPLGTYVGTVNSAGSDAGQSLTYTLLNSGLTTTGSQNVFVIDSQTGNITVNIPDSLDYETNSLFTMRVKVQYNADISLVDTSTISINLIDVPETKLSVNNFISPNADGVNDFLEIKNVEVYEGYLLTIFNSSGEIIYQTDKYTNNWDGSRNGSILPSGIYYYLFEKNNANTYKGLISLKNK